MSISRFIAVPLLLGAVLSVGVALARDVASAA